MPALVRMMETSKGLATLAAIGATVLGLIMAAAFAHRIWTAALGR